MFRSDAKVNSFAAAAGLGAGRLGRGVAADAVVAEPGDRVVERVAVIVDDALPLGRVAPEPAVVRAGRVLDHHRPGLQRRPQLRLRLALVPGRGGGVLLLDDHLAVGDRAGPAVHQPAHHARRVVHPDGRVGAVRLAAEERPGVADAPCPAASPARRSAGRSGTRRASPRTRPGGPGSGGAVRLVVPGRSRGPRPAVRARGPRPGGRQATQVNGTDPTSAAARIDMECCDRARRSSSHRRLLPTGRSQVPAPVVASTTPPTRSPAPPGDNRRPLRDHADVASASVELPHLEVMPEPPGQQDEDLLAGEVPEREVPQHRLVLPQGQVLGAARAPKSPAPRR